MDRGVTGAQVRLTSSALAIERVAVTNNEGFYRFPALPARLGRRRQCRHPRGFGPWYKGTYDAVSLTFNMRRGPRLNLAGSYTFTRAVDNLRCPDLVTGLSLCVPSDSFVGIPPVVTDPATGQTNARGPFTAGNGNPVPRAGIFYDGPALDRGPSDLAPDHAFTIYGIAELPWKFSVSGIFRLQSGFRFSRQAEVPVDVDGDLNFNPIDRAAGRNTFTAPTFVNLDIRVTRRWQVGDRVRLTGLVEVFNVFNSRNPAAVETALGRPAAFGKPLQVLPGREGQIGLRLEF